MNFVIIGMLPDRQPRAATVSTPRKGKIFLYAPSDGECCGAMLIACGTLKASQTPYKEWRDGQRGRKQVMKIYFWKFLETKKDLRHLG
jgi:hypothetical protein